MATAAAPNGPWQGCKRSIGAKILKSHTGEKVPRRLLTSPARPWFSRSMPAANATAVIQPQTLRVEQLVASVSSLALVVVVLITSLTGAE